MICNHIHGIGRQTVILSDKFLVHPRANVMDAHVFAVEHYNARTVSLVINVSIFLRQALTQAIPHEGIGPIRTTCPQDKIIKLGALSIVKKRVIQAPTAVSTSEINSQHFLWKNPAVLSVDLHTCAFVESSFVVAIIFEKLDIDWPFPIWLKILNVNTGIGIPKMIGICDQ